ncbi:hypothetical protein D3C71_913870 [compost metagenome]
MKTSLRIIKYALNLFGIIWILFITDLSFGLITTLPNCDRVTDIIISQLTKLSSFYLLFLLCITGINLLIERKLEKRIHTKEYLYLLIIQCILVVSIAFFVSKEFYDSCN